VADKDKSTGVNGDFPDSRRFRSFVAARSPLASLSTTISPGTRFLGDGRICISNNVAKPSPPRFIDELILPTLALEVGLDLSLS
jgi:hypothetical protein